MGQVKTYASSERPQYTRCAARIDVQFAEDGEISREELEASSQAIAAMCSKLPDLTNEVQARA